MTQAETKVKN